jgi:hypothetical protein
MHINTGYIGLVIDETPVLFDILLTLFTAVERTITVPIKGVFI